MSKVPIYGRILSDRNGVVTMAVTCPDCHTEVEAAAKHGELLLHGCECGTVLEMQL